MHEVSNTGAAALHIGPLKLGPGLTSVSAEDLASARAVLLPSANGPVSVFEHYESVGRLRVAAAEADLKSADAAPVDPLPALGADSSADFEDSATDALPSMASDSPAAPPVRRVKRRG